MRRKRAIRTPQMGVISAVAGSTSMAAVSGLEKGPEPELRIGLVASVAAASERSARRCVAHHVEAVRHLVFSRSAWRSLHRVDSCSIPGCGVLFRAHNTRPDPVRLTLGQVPVRCFDNQMVVIGHQAIGVA